MTMQLLEKFPFKKILNFKDFKKLNNSESGSNSRGPNKNLHSPNRRLEYKYKRIVKGLNVSIFVESHKYLTREK